MRRRMIARIWHGWVDSEEKADEYEGVLRSTFLPSANAIEGYCGAWVLRRAVGEEIEFTAITQFDSVEAAKRFAGEDSEVAHVAPRVREWLVRYDARCQHFDLVIEDWTNDSI
jgi:antibiotic biosynthesis monooxygenase (ABM) superfamily enzyme